MLTRLQTLEGLTHTKLKENIENIIRKIPKEKYENIFKGAYKRPEKYILKKPKKSKRIIYKWVFEIKKV